MMPDAEWKIAAPLVEDSRSTRWRKPEARCLRRGEMSRTLDVLRTLADEHLLRFVLVSARAGDGRHQAWPRELAELLAGRMCNGECLGWLLGGRMGVLLCQTAAREEDDLDVRAAWYGECLAEAGGVDIQVHEYPLQPLAGEKSPSGGAMYPEGGIERYFIKPTPAWKRALDVTLALAAVLALWPVAVLVALLVKCTSRGPVLFRQERTGIGGRPFTMYKFRSMVDGADLLQDDLRHLNEQDGPAFKIRRDPRVTRVGQVLRKTCLDELPQLWCVLRGEMSLVGPRPLPCRESAACEGWQRRRLEVAPGLTCLWQIRGRSLVSFDDWMRLDLEYILRRSLWLDLWIVAATVPALIPHRKIRQEDAAGSGEVATETP